jgi:hypothetical protein
MNDISNLKPEKTIKLINDINTRVTNMILIVHLNKLITKTEKDYWMALLTDERNKTIVALKTDLAIMKTIELMIKSPTQERWIKIIKEKAKKSLIVTNMYKASLAALVNTIKNILDSMVHPRPISQQAQAQQSKIVNIDNKPHINKLLYNANQSSKIWKLNLERVKKYINENKKRPLDKNVKILDMWIHYQKTIYQNKEYIMSASKIRQLWKDFINNDKYKKYFLSNKEKWRLNLERVKKYIDENKKKPLDKILSIWIYNQKIKYHKKEYIMSNKTIRHLWEDFINEYKMFFK